jgi:hypothetical protein
VEEGKVTWYEGQKQRRRASTPTRREHRVFAVVLGAVVAVAFAAHAGVAIDAHDHDALAALVGVEPAKWAALYERAVPVYVARTPRARPRGAKRKRPGVRKRDTLPPPTEGVPVGRSGRFVLGPNGGVLTLRVPGPKSAS